MLSIKLVQTRDYQTRLYQPHYGNQLQPNLNAHFNFNLFQQNKKKKKFLTTALILHKLYTQNPQHHNTAKSRNPN